MIKIKEDKPASLCATWYQSEGDSIRKRLLRLAKDCESGSSIDLWTSDAYRNERFAYRA